MLSPILLTYLSVGDALDCTPKQVGAVCSHYAEAVQ
jgi:hypothetical protein